MKFRVEKRPGVSIHTLANMMLFTPGWEDADVQEHDDHFIVEHPGDNDQVLAWMKERNLVVEEILTNVEKLRRKFAEMKASRLLDFKFTLGNTQGVTLEELAGELLSIIEQHENGPHELIPADKL
ncbi:MAG: hypothetical protein V4486_03095 [Patescibacteria group bacterium]